jgi:hypothetical protein
VWFGYRKHYLFDDGELRSLWREREGRESPNGFSKDLLARALAYAIQEEQLGGLSPEPKKLLANPDAEPPRRACGAIGVYDQYASYVTLGSPIGTLRPDTVTPLAGFDATDFGGFCTMMTTKAAVATAKAMPNSFTLRIIVTPFGLRPTSWRAILFYVWRLSDALITGALNKRRPGAVPASWFD